MSGSRPGFRVRNLGLVMMLVLLTRPNTMGGGGSGVAACHRTVYV